MATEPERNYQPSEFRHDASWSQWATADKANNLLSTPRNLSANAFQYQDLEPGRPCFRLLRLRGRFGPLRCELIHQTFEHGSFVPYEAVSYVWGSPEKCAKLLIGDAELPITM